MKCSDCKHWTYLKHKAYREYGECDGQFPDKKVKTFGEYGCQMFEMREEKKFMDSFGRLAESIRITFGL